LFGSDDGLSSDDDIDVVRGKGYSTVYFSNDQRSLLFNLKDSSSYNKLATKLADKTDVQSMLQLAQIYLIQNKLKQSETLCRKVLRSDIKNTEARVLLGQIAFRQGNNDLALIIFNGIGGDKSKESRVIGTMALIALAEKRSIEAMELFKKSLEIDSSDVATRMNLGLLYLKHRLLPEAGTQFERILKITPNNLDAKLHLAIVKSIKKENDGAYKLFKEVLKDSPNNPIALFNCAYLQKNIGEYDNALNNLKKYLKTAHARDSNTDDVFALITEIGNLKEKSGQGKLDDDAELQSVTNEINKKPRSNKNSQDLDEEDADIRALENELNK
jgi:tetratricopeptide (TPR) repeat protein